MKTEQLECYKTESLGNDFVLFDWLEFDQEHIAKLLNSPKWNKFVAKICQRHYGVGADGVLLISKNSAGFESQMYNSDGTKAEKCLNGIRCTANYLKQKFPHEKVFTIYMHNQNIPCQVDPTGLVTLSIDDVNYIKPLTIQLETPLTGHVVSAGNPHYVILTEISTEYLRQNGHAIETNSNFPNHTNVEFVWEDSALTKINGQRTFRMLVHERGVGITLACGSGAAATLKTLQHLKQVKADEKIIIKMPGGELTSAIDSANNISQQGHATLVFKTRLEIRY